MAAPYPTPLQRRAAEHNLKPGNSVLVHRWTLNGVPSVCRYRYDTGSILGLTLPGRADAVVTREPWDGVSAVSFDAGD